MCFPAPRNLCSSASIVVALITAVVLIAPFQSSAAGDSNTKSSNPEEYKRYRVHYDVNADGTYTESDELAKAVNTDRDVSMSRMFQVGFHKSGASRLERDIEILSAYTLKKNGTRVNAILPKIQNAVILGAPAVAAPIGTLAPRQPILINFQQVEIGDTLVYSYRAELKEPITPNNIILDQSFPKFVAYDDAEVSIGAPASMKLRIDTIEIGKAEKVIEGNLQKMVWKYQSRNPEAPPDPSHPVPIPMDSFPRIHISTFVDGVAEMHAISPSFGTASSRKLNPEEYKRYRVHYDVNADGTYTESDEFAKAVNSDQDVSTSRMYEAGLEISGSAVIGGGKDTDINILSAYTLKKNGEHVDAILPTIPKWAASLGPLPPNWPGVSGSSSMGVPQKPRKLIVFQKVEIGDTLVYSYRATQKQPVSPNNIVLVLSFPKVVAYDDAEISISAPTSMNLRVDTVAIGKAEKVVEGNIQKMVWKYQSKTPDELPDPTHPIRNASSDPRIQISSFVDAATQGFTLYTQMNKGCNAMWRIAHDGPEAINTSSGWISNAFLHNEKYLAYAVNELKNPECVFDDGRPMLVALSGGYDMAFKTQPDWSESLSRVEYFKKQYPGQAFVALAEAIYWKDYAWDARGEGFASSVTPDGRRLFKERLEKEEAVLNDTKSYSAELPVWYDEMIRIQSALDRPEDERDKTFLEGTKKFKTYYPIYFTMLNFLSPKWGGSWTTVDNMIKWSVDNTKEIDGTSMYARLYWAAYGVAPDGTNFFKDTLVSWPKMKQGFEDLMSRHPNSKWNLNNYAKFACMANDKDTFLALRNRIGKDIVDAAWPQNPSLDLCEIKFGYDQ